MWKTRLTAAGFENGGRKPQTEECRMPPESGKGQATNTPLEPPNRDTALWTR